MTPDQMSRLRELAQLRDEGILTEAEFTAKKTQMLGSVVPTGVPSNAPAPSASSTMGSRGMGFGEAISTGFSKYVDFSGRATIFATPWEAIARSFFRHSGAKLTFAMQSPVRHL